MYDKICRNCGTYLSDYYRTGMLGCPHCYTAFRPEIAKTLKKIQKSAHHEGKIPTLDPVGKELCEEYKRLLSEKEAAVMESRFSDVKRISGELIDLKAELERRGLL
ncbi:MAG: hypothetical protein J5911_00330 [Clostridia bacterium]|nr:hypothetical protein [Clostridia bacterium]